MPPPQLVANTDSGQWPSCQLPFWNHGGQSQLGQTASFVDDWEETEPTLTVEGTIIFSWFLSVRVRFQ